MKRLSILFILLTLTVFAYGLEIQVGPTALYNYFIDNETAPSTDVSFDDFTFGAEARIKLGLLEGTALGLYSPPADDIWPAELEMFLTGGVAVDFVLLRAGIGVGPNLLFILDESETEPINLGANLKLHADLMLGDISVSLNYIILLPDLTEESLSVAEDSEGLVGLSVLFEL